MSGYSAVKVEVFFDLSALSVDGLFIIGQSLIEGDDVIAGEISTDLTPWTYAVSTSRGRSRELDTIQTGTCQVRLRNYDGRFLPDTFNDPYLTDEDGNVLTDEDGDPLLSESAPYLGQIFPGKRVRIAMAANDEPIFVGRIDEWRYTFDADGRVDAWFEAYDSLGVLASQSFNDWESTAGQSPGERINDVLDRPEVDWGPARNIGSGVATLQSDAVSWGSNVLNYLSLVTATDRGLVFDSRDGVLTFIGRDQLTSAATLFADDPADVIGEERFTSIDIASSSEQLFNRVGVDREGGILQTVSSRSSQEAYGVRALQVVGLLVETDEQSLSLARNLLDQYSQPANRVAAVTVVLDALDPADPADYRIPLHDLGDMVKVRWTPRGSSAVVEQLSVVEGKYHQVTVDGLHTVRYALSPAENLTGFIIGDPFFGVIGQSRIAF
jgi:hypothetical protein